MNTLKKIEHIIQDTLKNPYGSKEEAFDQIAKVIGIELNEPEIFCETCQKELSDETYVVDSVTLKIFCHHFCADAYQPN